MKNIEYKVKVANHLDVIAKLRAMKARKKVVLKQTDTYIPCDEGRLKIRQIHHKFSELIFYKRVNRKNSKNSFYDIVTLSSEQGRLIAKIFTAAYTKAITVSKKRELWMYKHTRIHIDTVDHLGKFVELETVIKTISSRAGQKEHAFVKRALQLEKYKALATSYGDMIKKI